MSPSVLAGESPNVYDQMSLSVLAVPFRQNSQHIADLNFRDNDSQVSNNGPTLLIESCRLKHLNGIVLYWDK